MKKISILFCSLLCLVFATTARASMNDTINPVTGQPIPPLPDDMTELMTRGATSTSSGGLSVTLSAGWNWIGYMGASTKAINEALKTIQPSHGDMIKSQSQQASYSSATGLWSGPLTTLEPGKGYLYLHYGAPVTLEFQGMFQEAIYTVPTGAVEGVFSVSARDQVYFSKGNLQYKASTHTWRFAENQWDYVGSQSPESGTSGGTVSGSDNANLSSTYNGWIDLFGWGTSGYNHGATCYQPWSTSLYNSDYYVYGNSTYNLYDQTGMADWGYNSISNGGNQSGLWQTLTREEWAYVFNTRNTPSGIRYARARVNGVNGVILLPDDWSSSYRALNNTNTANASYSGNTITSSDWMSNLESHGAVFLPAAGFRIGSSLYSVGSYGSYWSSSNYNTNNAWFVYSNDSNISWGSHDYKRTGYSVRLVKKVPNPGVIDGKFTVSSSGSQVYFSQGNLQYHASTRTWRFAENQWDYVGSESSQYGVYGGTVSGSDNASLSSTYNGWIDLFGWGMSGYNHGALCYQPWSVFTDYSYYYAYGNSAYNLYDQTGMADWGYNPISNGGNQSGLWRTLTREEWAYVFNTRNTPSGIRYAKAKVNGVNGVILLPDNWSSSYHTLSNTNVANADHSSNIITSSDWTSNLESHGAVFLPAAGYRIWTSLYFVGTNGQYWSASSYGSDSAREVYFNGSNLSTDYGVYRYVGQSVRLVCNAE